MDDDRFDHIAKTLAGSASRRVALRVLGGTALGAVLTWLGVEQASAACLAPGATCRTSGACCSGRCKKRKGHRRGKCTTCGTGKKFCPAVPACQACCANTDCPGSETCQSGTCRVCPAGTFLCATGVCCPNGQACVSGACAATCPANPNSCGNPATRCGETSAGNPCGCVTAKDGTTTCSSFYGECFSCTTNAQCTTQLGVPAVCVTCSNCPESTLCIFAGCIEPPSSPTAAGSASKTSTRWKRPLPHLAP